MARWIEKALDTYRTRVRELSALRVPGLDARGEERAPSVIGLWGMRYDKRREAIESIRSVDRWLVDALQERNRAADHAVPGKPHWPESLAQFTSGPGMTHWTRVGEDAPHPHGPSLRRMWLEAERVDPDLDAILDAILAWARGPTPEPAPAPAPRWLKQALIWHPTPNPAEPWAADADGRALVLRLGDFPEEEPWTLLVDGEPAGSFSEWPKPWSRGKPAAPREAPAVVSKAADRWLERYRAGAHVEVWKEIVAAGPEVRTATHLPVARAVAAEAMRRLRHDLDLLVPRLLATGYAFGAGEPPPPRFAVGGPSTRRLSLAEMLAEVPAAKPLFAMLDALRAATPSPPPQPRVAPDPGDLAALRRLEGQGFVLPLALEAFIAEVGAVDLTGRHPVLCPDGARDPLMVSPWANTWGEAIEEAASEWAPGEGPVALMLALQPEDKAAMAMGENPLWEDGIAVAVPAPGADAVLVGAGGATLVEWLRRAMGCGGFAGWDGGPMPVEVRQLTEGFVGF